MNWIKPDWPVAKNIHAAVTLRSGGSSQNNYASLNLAIHVDDVKETVIKNRQAISKTLQLPSQPKWLEQVHGSRVVKADGLVHIMQADASFTDQANTVCVVLTADCLPVLLASKDGLHIAAIHAGWRGLLLGIISNAVKKLDSINTIAWLGPAIGPAKFEVGLDVRTAFVDKSIKFSSAFLKTKKAKYLADIYQLATIELAMAGIHQVYGGGFCTFSDIERFYSYRRDGKTGRMATLIWRD